MHCDQNIVLGEIFFNLVSMEQITLHLLVVQAIVVTVGL